MLLEVYFDENLKLFSGLFPLFPAFSPDWILLFHTRVQFRKAIKSIHAFATNNFGWEIFGVLIYNLGEDEVFWNWWKKLIPEFTHYFTFLSSSIHFQSQFLLLLFVCLFVCFLNSSTHGSFTIWLSNFNFHPIEELQHFLGLGLGILSASSFHWSNN